MARHGSFTLNELGILLDELGYDVARAFIQKGSFRMARAGEEAAKHGYLSLGQDEAFRNRVLAGVTPEKQSETIRAILRGEISITLTKTDRNLFTGSDALVPGRFIPFLGLRSEVVDPDPRYHFLQPQFNYVEILKRVRKNLSLVSGLRDDSRLLPSAIEFEERVLGPNGIKAKLDNDPRTKNATKGVWFPWVLPQITGDYGYNLDRLIIAVRAAYEKTYSEPQRTFGNYRHGTLYNNVKVIPGTRHELLVDALARGPVVGVTLFPFDGYSVDAVVETFTSHELSRQIPDWLILGGGYDTAAAYITHAKEIGRDALTPNIRCAALKWQSKSLSWCAGDADAHFNSIGDLEHANNVSTAAVTVIG